MMRTFADSKGNKLSPWPDHPLLGTASLLHPQVRPLFQPSSHGKEVAIVRFNLTRYMNNSESETTVSVTQPDRQHVMISLISICATSAIVVMTICFMVWWCFCCGTHIRRIPDHDEDSYHECHPIFLEKELYDPTKVKYDVTSPIGTGQYGNVYKGEVLLKDCKDWTMVAVKVAKEHEIGWKEDFLDEIKLLLQLGEHPNVIKIHGCCSMTNPPLLITEFMRYGDLLSFLHRCRIAESSDDDIIYSVTEADLIFIAQQVARGMSGCSNVLIGEGLKAKISDFGLADDLYEKGYKEDAHGRKRPMRWVSIETLRSGFCSDKSDVWSFGILLYEIFTLGATPYHDIPIHEIATTLQDGYRLPKPDSCPQEIYNTMRQCWNENPTGRPSFSQLEEVLDCLQQDRQTNVDSGSSFISSCELRNAVFQPHFEEDDLPSLPVGPLLPVDSGSFSGSVIDTGSFADSESNVGSVIDSGAGSIDTGTNFYPYEQEMRIMESHSEEEEDEEGPDRGFKNLAFDSDEAGESDENRNRERSTDVGPKNESVEVQEGEGKSKIRTVSTSLEDEGIVKDEVISDMIHEV
ncbi:putative vascular endothelial growth factor receptor 1-like [Apostichopus japonicus]|uniref:Putative vascular endothelial growth factor receptor 1-like n=1 Tax=Stichopus japonicus TaxID=307972 RepID=A0A2G8LA29_STIJA|nr:putative vascular endothelial growth factor receptor 1-like [Apostichopus japonicus]